MVSARLLELSRRHDEGGHRHAGFYNSEPQLFVGLSLGEKVRLDLALIRDSRLTAAECRAGRNRGEVRR